MKTITVRTKVNAPIEKVWEFWNEPKHITKWNQASDDWHSPSAKVDLRKGGSFTVRMEAKDKSSGFDFNGTYTFVEKHRLIEYEMEDGRKVKITFEKAENSTKVTETFDMEDQNSEEMQRAGWQAILDNFKKYVEQHP